MNEISRSEMSDSNENMTFEEFKHKFKAQEIALSENQYNPANDIPGWIKAMKNFDPTGVSGYILDVLEGDQKKAEEEAIKYAIYKLFSSYQKLNKKMKILESQENRSKLGSTVQDYFRYSKEYSDKIDIFINIFVNGVTSNVDSIDEIRECFKVISSLTVRQIKILKIHYDIQSSYDFEFLRNNNIIINPIDITKKLDNSAATIPEILADLSILSGKGMLADWGIGRFDYDGPINFILTDYAKKIIKLTLEETSSA